MTLEEIAKEALALPHDQRARLTSQLEHSFNQNELDSLWGDLALQRQKQIQEKQVPTVTRQEALARVRASVSQ